MSSGVSSSKVVEKDELAITTRRIRKLSQYAAKRDARLQSKVRTQLAAIGSHSNQGIRVNDTQ